MKSRMTRECHVRFREGLEAKFLGGCSTGSKGRGPGWLLRRSLSLVSLQTTTLLPGRGRSRDDHR